jgi:hypothetical protein
MTLDARHGKSTELFLGDADVSTYFNSLDLSADVDTADTTTFKSSWKSAVVGAAGAKFDGKGYYDPSLTNLPALLGTYPGAVFTEGPAGLGSVGDRARLGLVLATAYAESSPVGGAVNFSWAVALDGALAFGQALHPKAEDTNTTTGADKDDSASTSTGWTAHLHVTAVDGGSWVIKLQDAATTDWTDVTGGAFTAATGATSQRLTGATSTTTLRRHVRYVATRTGGAGGDGITFALAYART